MRSADRLSRYLAKELSLDEERADYVRFGAEIVFSTVLGAAVVVATAYLLGCLPETLAVLAAYAGVRTFAGGAHCSTPWRCAISTMLVFPALGKAAAELPAHLSGLEPHILLVIAFTGFLVVAGLAPVDSPVNPIEDPKRRKTLKRNSIIAVVVITSVLSSVPYLFPASAPSLIMSGAFGLAWSAAVLTRPVHRLMDLLDQLLGRCAAFRRAPNR